MWSSSRFQATTNAAPWKPRPASLPPATWSCPGDSACTTPVEPTARRALTSVASTGVTLIMSVLLLELTSCSGRRLVALASALGIGDNADRSPPEHDEPSELQPRDGQAQRDDQELHGNGGGEGSTRHDRGQDATHQYEDREGEAGGRETSEGRDKRDAGFIAVRRADVPRQAPPA